MSTPKPKFQGLWIDSPATWVGKAPFFSEGSRRAYSDSQIELDSHSLKVADLQGVHRLTLTGRVLQVHSPFQWTQFHCAQPFFLFQGNFILDLGR